MALLKWFLISAIAITPAVSEHHHSKDKDEKLSSKSSSSSARRQGIIPSEEEILSMASNFKKHHFDSIPNPPTKTTTVDVPDLFRAALRQYSTIDEAATDYLPAEVATRKMEEGVGWDVDHFSKDASPIQNLIDRGGLTRDENPAEQILNNLNKYMDIVIPSIRDLDFLDVWRPFLEGFHLILVQDGDPDRYLKIPAWADYELYNRRDIEAALGDRAWIISQKDASIRNFGFLVSQKKLVYTVDDDCRPAMGPDGKLVNAVVEHARNLLSPSTPFFFNTVYDPYRGGSDFVRGFPYSMRAGVATAVSHGLWMHNYDYDAPTQLLKVDEKNERYVDATLTVPKGVLYPLCSMNVAFDRELIGPAFMQGLMGVGQPWGRYDDMWAGWASKTVADHLGVGSKSGHPYIKHNKASNPFTNLLKEYKGLEWQEKVIRFFDTVKLSEETKNDAGDAYIELSWKVHHELGKLNVYFERLGLAMRTWVEVWRESQQGKIVYVPSRRSGLGPIAQDRAAKMPASLRGNNMLTTTGINSPTSSSSSSTSSEVDLHPVVVQKDGAVKKVATVVFAGDERYLHKILAVVEKLRALKHGKAYRIILNLMGEASEKTKSQLRCAVPSLIDELREFQANRYPAHVAKLGCYAWKPVIIAALYREFPDEGLVWLDSGLSLAGPPESHGMFIEAAIEAAVQNGGVISDKTARDLMDFTHKGMFDYFDKHWSYKQEYFTEASPPVFNCNGAFSAWAPRNANMAKGIGAMDMWEKCALDNDCVCPAGSSRSNHRQDQAALTLSLATHGFRCYTDREHGTQGVRGPDSKGVAWVHAHGLRMSSVHCQDVECFVKSHAPQCVA